MFDSFDANCEFYDRVLRHMGSSLDRSNEETARILHTYANREVLATFFPDQADFLEAVRFAGTINYLDLVPLMKMEAGFMETLEQLHKRFHLAVCTNRSTSMESVLQSYGLTDYFSCVMTAAKVHKPKPDPEPLRKVLDHYGISAAETLFVGDSEVDCKAASAAAVPFIAYKANLPAHARINHHSEILSLVSVY